MDLYIIVPRRETSKVFRRESHSFMVYLQTTPCLHLLCKRSPDGTTTDCGRRHLIAAYFSFIDPERMKSWVGQVGWPIADSLPS